MEMQTVLDLQKLEVAETTDSLFGNSCTSSWYTCCNGDIAQKGDMA